MLIKALRYYFTTFLNIKGGIIWSYSSQYCTAQYQDMYHTVYVRTVQYCIYLNISVYCKLQYTVSGQSRPEFAVQGEGVM